VVLVVLVVILFLQTWRASIIPLIAVPVSVVGTFSILYLLGFSLNTLSLFGLVLAIGIVVDDAIVVVENVERNIEEGLRRLRRRIRRCVKCPGRLSRLRWCCARCLCRWRFCRALPVSSTSSLR
jgi:multidrug efflux pump